MSIRQRAAGKAVRRRLTMRACARDHSQEDLEASEETGWP